MKKEKKPKVEVDFVTTFPGDDAKKKKPRKVKTTKELIEDMQKLEKRILNEVIKNPARALEIGRMYMAGYNTFNSKQKEAYRRVASAVQAR
jgi:Mor family transcriptional regulator